MSVPLIPMRKDRRFIHADSAQRRGLIQTLFFHSIVEAIRHDLESRARQHR